MTIENMQTSLLHQFRREADVDGNDVSTVSRCDLDSNEKSWGCDLTFIKAVYRQLSSRSDGFRAASQDSLRLWDLARLGKQSHILRCTTPLLKVVNELSMGVKLV